MDAFDPDHVPPAPTRDLGSIDMPVLVCGGAYSNLEAMTALFAAASDLGIPSSRIIHTGDVIAYCADPVASATLLRESGAHAIQGNVEESLWEAMPDCGCGFDEGSECEKLSAEWFAFADKAVDDDLRRWMGTLPLQLTFTMAGHRLRVIHGAVNEINRFLFASTPADIYDAEFTAAGTDIVIAGHSGLPFTRRFGARVWHNSGALGMPANDGTPRVWFSLITPEGEALRFEHIPLDYDHEGARNKMIAAGLPDGYATALESGLWPSVDVLPDAEKSRSGLPIDAGELNCATTAVASAV